MTRVSLDLLRRTLPKDQYEAIKNQLNVQKNNPAEDWLKQTVTDVARELQLEAETEYAPIPGRRFRLDAAIPALKLGFECDGWQFHAKHKDVWLREKVRDRLFLSHGWHVYRFAASEILSGHASLEIEQIVKNYVDGNGDEEAAQLS